jgi:hypothetical protein
MEYEITDLISTDVPVYEDGLFIGYVVRRRLPEKYLGQVYPPLDFAWQPEKIEEIPPAKPGQGAKI